DPAQIGARDAYEFWDGSEWSGSAADARPLWAHEVAASQVESLTSFENGASIAYSRALGKYVALQNVGIGAIGARTADRVEGPWSAPQPWVDCNAIASPAVPTCYSPFQHPELASDDGRRMFVTFTRLATYDTLVYELTFGTSIHEYRAADERIAYGATPPSGSGWQDDGIVFYASDAALPGFVAVYRWERDGDVRYATSSP